MGGISKELDLLSCEAIEQCLELLETGEDLWPTLFYRGDTGELLADVFEGDSPDVGLAAAYHAVAELPPTCALYAIAYDGCVQADESTEALLALILEFGERGSTHAYSACIPYTRDGGGMAVGEPVPGGEEPLRFC